MSEERARVQLRLPPHLRAKMETIAARDGCSLNAVMVAYLRACVDARKAAPPVADTPPPRRMVSMRLDEEILQRVEERAAYYGQSRSRTVEGILREFMRARDEGRNDGG